MSGLVVRDRLVYPVAMALALGAVTVAQPEATSSPRIAEVSAIRLQAEVTSYVGGLSDAAVTSLASAPRAVAPDAASAAALGEPWPSTWLEKLVYNLPPEIQSIVIPPLYVVAMVVGAIMGVFYTIFGWPKDLLPAAAAPQAPRGAAASVAPANPAGSDSSGASADPGADRAADHAVTPTVAERAVPVTAPAGQTRGRHPVAVADDEVGGVTPKSVVLVPPAAAAQPVSAAGIVTPAAETVTPETVSPEVSALETTVESLPAIAVTADQTPPAAAPGDDAPAVVNHPARARAWSADSGSTDNAPARAARRSAQ